MNLSQFRKAYRNRYRGHGGYVWAWALRDGEILCLRCGEKNLRGMINALAEGVDNGWRAEALIQIEGSELNENCVHCAKLLKEGEENDPD